MAWIRIDDTLINLDAVIRVELEYRSPPQLHATAVYIRDRRDPRYFERHAFDQIREAVGLGPDPLDN